MLPEHDGKVYRYVNSGTFIGKSWALKKLYSMYPYDNTTDDQRFMTTAYLDIIENHRGFIDIKLDTETQIFMCLAGRMSDFRYDFEQGRFQSFYTNNWPAICHFNGQRGDTRPSFEKWNSFHNCQLIKYDF